MGMWTGRSKSGASSHSRPRDCMRRVLCDNATGKPGRPQSASTRKPGDQPCTRAEALENYNGRGVPWGLWPGQMSRPLHESPPLLRSKGDDMKRIITAAGLSLAASPALAHHPLGGLPMETFTHGLMSGAGHPVLGFDHLFFVVAMGIAALFTGRKLMTPAAYIGAMLAGCGLMYAGIAMPIAETVIVLSLIVLGGIVLSGKALNTTAPAWLSDRSGRDPIPDCHRRRLGRPKAGGHRRHSHQRPPRRGHGCRCRDLPCAGNRRRAACDCPRWHLSAKQKNVI